MSDLSAHHGQILKVTDGVDVFLVFEGESLGKLSWSLRQLAQRVCMRQRPYSKNARPYSWSMSCSTSTTNFLTVQLTWTSRISTFAGTWSWTAKGLIPDWFYLRILLMHNKVSRRRRREFWFWNLLFITNVACLLYHMETQKAFTICGPEPSTSKTPTSTESASTAWYVKIVCLMLSSKNAV